MRYFAHYPTKTHGRHRLLPYFSIFSLALLHLLLSSSSPPLQTPKPSPPSNHHSQPPYAATLAAGEPLVANLEPRCCPDQPNEPPLQTSRSPPSRLRPATIQPPTDPSHREQPRHRPR
ncbi:hypothetical protein Droror1_Dr00010348 [Drosera rotundifolia]